MLSVPLSWYLLLSAALFTIGVAGLMLRRNLIVMFMCIELMLNAVNLAFVAFSRYRLDLDGHIVVMMVIAVAAAEAGVGLALIVSIYRHRQTLDATRLNLLRH
jgi:NADH-quinone oxidoreductase subunit K